MTFKTKAQEYIESLNIPGVTVTLAPYTGIVLNESMLADSVDIEVRLNSSPKEETPYIVSITNLLKKDKWNETLQKALLEQINNAVKSLQNP